VRLVGLFEDNLDVACGHRLTDVPGDDTSVSDPQEARKYGQVERTVRPPRSAPD
jgi:hypothetical protein